MSENNDLQQQLFRHLRQQLPPHISLVDELSELLDISVDSVYRRIRGEKLISMSELKKICERYGISVDQFLHLENETLLFHAPGLNDTTRDFGLYMKRMKEHFAYFSSFQSRQIFYLCKDIPFWYFFLYPEIAAFKIFFWERTVNNNPAFVSSRFSLEEHRFSDCFDLGREVLAIHNTMNSVELWNLESIHSTINQIAYYQDAGIFKNTDDFEQVVTSFSLLLDHLEEQVKTGNKSMPGNAAVAPGFIEFYVNELILGNNTILLRLDDRETAMITYNILSYLSTNEERYVRKTFDTFHNLLKSATLISKTGEKERNKFFNRLREKVQALRNGHI